MTTVESVHDQQQLRIVVVDNRPERRLLIRHLVESTGLAAPEIGEASTTAEAVDLIGRDSHDVAVVEIQMPVTQGMETIAALRECSSGMRIVVCSFAHDPGLKERALAMGADEYLDKPVSSLTLRTVLGQYTGVS